MHRLLIAVTLAWHLCSSAIADTDAPPRVLDPRFELRLVMSDPDIVTPIGAAVDARGRLFVIESHTHDAPRDYKGPKSDRIKILTDQDGDGFPETQRIFAEGLHQAMNLVFGADGTLYVVTATEIFALRDRDGDDVCDERTSFLKLESENSNPHGRLLALTLSHDGWLYTSRGNVGGVAYAFLGADGRKIEGRGEGGEIVRCRTDGSQLERVATGFWNPFDLRFDRHGRLLCVDNDPDSRGPNRLLHIVRGGDYGYKARFGSTGLHPYDAWEGDLPGTLPMIAGVGEAPCAVLDASRAGFPDDLGDAMLVTVWGEHNVTLYRPHPVGVSIRATGERFIEGGPLFRPIALAPAPDGSVFITDWVLKDYPNHGRGRIWRLALKAGEKGRVPRGPFVRPENDAAFAEYERLTSAQDSAKLEELTQALRGSDPFLQTAAAQSLARPVFREAVLALLKSDDAALRLGALLALRRGNLEDPVPVLRQCLGDADASVRQMALIWTGESALTSLRPDLDRAVTEGYISSRLFDTWLATVQLLQGDAGLDRKGEVDPVFIERIAHDETRPPQLRALALPRLKAPEKTGNVGLLTRLARTAGDTSLRVEALRSLGTLAAPETAPMLSAIALDGGESAVVRCEALLALSSQPDAASELLPLLDDAGPGIALQAVRTLRFASGVTAVREALERRLAAAGELDPRVRDEIEFALGRPAAATRPTTLEDWQREFSVGGDAASGERVFFSPTVGCVQCHRIRQRGGIIGPELSVVARTANRAQLIHSIVKPSDDIAPQFQGWVVVTKDGQSIMGLQGHLRGGGAVTIITLDGRTLNIPGRNVASFQAMPASLMPEGLCSTMSSGDFRDLVAFLESLR